MGRQERLQKEFDAIEGKLRFFRSAILALLSALVWSAYALIEKKSRNRNFNSGRNRHSYSFLFSYSHKIIRSKGTRYLRTVGKGMKMEILGYIIVLIVAAVLIYLGLDTPKQKGVH